MFSPLALIAQSVKNLPAVQDPEFDSWVRKLPWRRTGKPLQYSHLENPMDRGAWQATVCGVPRIGQDLVNKPLPPLLP